MMTRTPEEERILLEHDDKAMIENPQLWPCRPWLPVTHRTRNDPHGTGLPDDGIIFEILPTMVIVANMFMPQLTPYPKLENYATVDELLKDWQVD